MRRKRSKVVVTVTETWTFFFDDAGEPPMPAPSLDPPALASTLTPPLDAAPLAADAPDGQRAGKRSSAAGQGV